MDNMNFPAESSQKRFRRCLRGNPWLRRTIFEERISSPLIISLIGSFRQLCLLPRGYISYISTLIRMHRTRSFCFDTAPILVLCAKCPACIAKTVFYGWSILWPVKVDMVVIRHGQGKTLHILSRDVPNLIMTNSSLLKMATEILVNFPIEHCHVPYFYVKNLPEGQWKKCL